MNRGLLKALAHFKKTPLNIWEQIYLSDWFDYIYAPLKAYRKYREMLGRMFFWAWKMRWSWDFDANTVYEMLHLKLSRVHDCMKEHGHLEWNANHDSNLMRKLAEAKMLAKKLSDENYRQNVERFYDMYKREKARNGWLEKSLAKYHPKAKPINEKLHSYFFKKAAERDDAERAYDKKRLYYLMDKYLESWWD
jgi:hypothetical protein